MTSPSFSRLCFTLLMILFWTNTAYAEIPLAAQKLIEQARTKQLAKNPTWHHLMHYKTTPSKSGVKSQVLDSDFFFSQKGKTNPEAELESTLIAFFEPVSASPNAHPVCRFPARLKWLEDHLDWGETKLSQDQCTDLKLWTNNDKIDSIDLIFVTGFFDNPTSYYGHLLLKFNTPKSENTSNLMERTVNFGAKVPLKENPAAYLSKGLLGGYKATFSDPQFFVVNHAYSERELRDLWAYQLSLTHDEVLLVSYHSWELLGTHFKYYFLDKNCAYYIADMLRIVIDAPLFDDKKPWTIPSSIFDKLTETLHHGAPLVTKIEYFPSRQSRFYAKYKDLSPHLKKVVKSATSQPDLQRLPSYQALSIGDKTRVVETLLDYNNFIQVSHPKDQTIKKAQQTLLLERLDLKTQSPLWMAGLGSAPHYGQRPSRLRMGTYHDRGKGPGVIGGFRAAYYDFLSLDDGRPANSQLRMFDIAAKYNKKGLTLEELVFVEIETLNLSPTGLKGDGGIAWNFSFGFRPEDLSSDASRFFLNVGGGKAFQVSKNLVLAGFLEGRHHPLDSKSELGIAPRLTAIYSPLIGIRSLFIYGNEIHVNGDYEPTPFLVWETRFGKSKSQDFRIRYERHVDTRILASISLYY